jgi:hypothetical protein
LNQQVATIQMSLRILKSKSKSIRKSSQTWQESLWVFRRVNLKSSLQPIVNRSHTCCHTFLSFRLMELSPSRLLDSSTPSPYRSLLPNKEPHSVFLWSSNQVRRSKEMLRMEAVIHKQTFSRRSSSSLASPSMALMCVSCQASTRVQSTCKLSNRLDFSLRPTLLRWLSRL